MILTFLSIIVQVLWCSHVLFFHFRMFACYYDGRMFACFACSTSIYHSCGKTTFSHCLLSRSRRSGDSSLGFRAGSLQGQIARKRLNTYLLLLFFFHLSFCNCKGSTAENCSEEASRFGKRNVKPINKLIGSTKSLWITIPMNATRPLFSLKTLNCYNIGQKIFEI